jgi:hypothetical protein
MVSTPSEVKAFNAFQQRLNQAAVGTLFEARNPALLRFMAGDLLRPADLTPPGKKIEFLRDVHKLSMSPPTLEAYEASPLQAVARNGAEKSLKAIIEWAKKRKESPMDPEVVNAAMCDIITATVPHEVSCSMIRMLLKMGTYRAFACEDFSLDHSPCFAVSQGRMDILQQFCCEDPDTKNIPMTGFVTKKGADERCECDEDSCNVAVWVQLHEMGFDLSGCQEYYEAGSMPRMCGDELEVFNQTEKMKPDREADECDSYDSDAECDEEEGETKKRKLPSD